MHINSQNDKRYIITSRRAPWRAYCTYDRLRSRCHLVQLLPNFDASINFDDSTIASTPQSEQAYWQGGQWKSCGDGNSWTVGLWKIAPCSKAWARFFACHCNSSKDKTMCFLFLVTFLMAESAVLVRNFKRLKTATQFCYGTFGTLGQEARYYIPLNTRQALPRHPAVQTRDRITL